MLFSMVARYNNPKPRLNLSPAPKTSSKSKQMRLTSFFGGNRALNRPIPCSHVVGKRKDCLVCPIMRHAEATFTSTVTGRKYDVPTYDERLTCNTKRVVYLVTCVKCGLQYVGQTEPGLRLRMNKTRSDALAYKACSDSKLSSVHLTHHFSGVDRCNGKHLRIQPIERVADGVSISAREVFWILNLRTVFPYGMNDRADVPDYNDEISIERNFTPIATKRGVKKRARRPQNGQRVPFMAVTLLNSWRNMLETEYGWIRKVRLDMNRLKKSQLRSLSQCVHNSLHGGRLDNSLNGRVELLLRICDDMISTRLDPGIPKKAVKDKPELIWNIRFVNRALNHLGLGRLLRSEDVDNSLPTDLSIPRPCIVFKYGQPVRNRIFNYRSALESIMGRSWLDGNPHPPPLSDVSAASLSHVSNVSCGCASSEFCHGELGHVVTGDLGLVENDVLRNILSKGPNYKEPVAVNYVEMREAIVEGMDEMIAMWSTKCDRDMMLFNGWKICVLKAVDDRIESMKRTYTDNLGREQVLGLRNKKVAKALSELHKSYVLVSADKAAGNVIIVCKKYYIQCMVHELTLNPDRTYEEVVGDKDELMRKICDEMKEKFDIEVPEGFRKFAYLYWTAKMHKTPPKQRFIAGGRMVESKILSRQITHCLKAVYGVHKRECDRLRSNTGVAHMWVANSSKEVIRRIDRINKRMGAKDVATYDFQTLYTKIPHLDLKAEMKWVVEEAFRLAKEKGKDVLSLRGSSAEFVSKTRSGKSISMVMLSSMIDYLIDHIYVACGDRLFRQTIGIPMGTNCAPMLANLYLFALETKWVRKICTDDKRVAAQFAHCFRYIDDLILLNNNGCLSSRIQDIYPVELVLGKENSSDYAATFLDLRLAVNNGRFTRMLYDKRDAFPFTVVNFPDLSGNVHVRNSHGVVVGQLIRYAIACDHADQFFKRSAMMMKRLLSQGFVRRWLESYCSRFFSDRFYLVRKYRVNVRTFNARCFSG